MRYTDEGNLRFSGNTRTSSPNQGVYRQELNEGKYAVTLTNTEPGLGYLGFNADALSFDFENCELCTINISASNVDVCETMSASCVNVSDTIVTHCLESCCGLCFECGCISNGPAEIRLYGRPNDNPTNGCLVVADNYLCYCTLNDCASIEIGPDKLYLGGHIRAGNAPYLCVEDTLVDGFLFTNSCFDCHYIYGIRKNGSNAFTDTGVLDIGAVGSAVAVNGSCYVANDNGVMSLPNMTTSITLNNITYNASNAGNINLGTITATVDLNSSNSLLITNCTFANSPLRSVAIGYNSNITNVSTASGSIAIGPDSTANGDYSTAIGPGSLATGSYNVAVGCGVESGYLTAAFGIRAKACGSGNIAIGRDVIMCSDTGKIVGIVQSSRLYTSNTYSNFGSLQIAIKCNTLECDLYNLLESIILNNIDNVFESNRQNKDYLLLDKAIYRCGTDLQILGVGDTNTRIKYSSTSIDVGSRMTLHKNCDSPIVLCCPGTANYEVWNILY